MHLASIMSIYTSRPKVYTILLSSELKKQKVGHHPPPPSIKIEQNLRGQEWHLNKIDENTNRSLEPKGYALTPRVINKNKRNEQYLGRNLIPRWYGNFLFAFPHKSCTIKMITMEPWSRCSFNSWFRNILRMHSRTQSWLKFNEYTYFLAQADINLCLTHLFK